METNEQPYLLGELKAVFFENPSNFYKVLLIELHENNFPIDKDEIVVTGNFGDISLDTVYRFTGTAVTHPKYGIQFQAVSYEREKPTGKNGMIAFLSSDRFPGIGERTAEKIVDTLGEQAIDAILDHPDCLKQVSGLNEKKRQMIYDVLQQVQGTEKTIIELANLGFTNHQAAAIMQVYKTETLQIVRENPYQLIQDIDGIGFKRADQLAMELDIEADDKNRIKGAIISTVQDLCLSNGDTYVESNELFDRSLQLLETSRRFVIEDQLLIESVVEMVENMELVEDQKRFALPSLFFAEEGIASSLHRLLKKDKSIDYPGVDFKEEISKMEDKLNIQYDDIQADAIEQALTRPFLS